MPCRFLVVCEAEADFRLASRLVERVICERVDWVDDNLLRSCPIWFPLDRQTPFLKWSKIKDIAEQEKLPPVRGEFGGRGGQYDANNARRVFQLFKLWQYQHKEIDGIVLVRDYDGLPERFTWLVKARAIEDEIGHLVVIGVAYQERESWILSGFEPQNERETAMLAELRRELTFDPCLNPERLRAQHGTRGVKTVLDRLTQDDRDREEACWALTSLSTLHDRGVPSGMAAFLDEVANRLVPLFGRQSA